MVELIVIVTVVGTAIAARWTPHRTARLSATSNSPDLPCPWCQGTTDESDLACPTCQRAFGAATV